MGRKEAPAKKLSENVRLYIHADCMVHRKYGSQISILGITKGLSGKAESRAPTQISRIRIYICTVSGEQMGKLKFGEC